MELAFQHVFAYFHQRLERRYGIKRNIKAIAQDLGVPNGTFFDWTQGRSSPARRWATNEPIMAQLAVLLELSPEETDLLYHALGKAPPNGTAPERLEALAQRIQALELGVDHDDAVAQPAPLSPPDPPAAPRAVAAQPIARPVGRGVVLLGVLAVLVLIPVAYGLLSGVGRSGADSNALTVTSAALAPSAAVTHAATPTLTPTPGPTPTEVIDLVAEKLAADSLLAESYAWSTVISETFDTVTSTQLLTTTDDYGNHATVIVDGGLSFTARSTTPGGAVIWDLQYALPELGDFALSVDITCQICDGDTSPGLIFRRSGPLNSESFYYVRYETEDQTIRIAKQPAGHSMERLALTVASNINKLKNTTNRLTVIARGDHLAVFVNGNYAINTRDASLTRGTIHPAVYIPRDSHATLILDNLEIRTP